MVKEKDKLPKKSRGVKQQAIFELLSLLVIILFINIISSFLFTRFDFTREKRFTLSKATRDMLSELPDQVVVKVYLEGEFPAGFKRLRNSTKEILDEFSAWSGGKLQYDFIDPTKEPDEKIKNELYQQLVKYGLTPIDLNAKTEQGTTQQVVFPGAIVNYREGQEAVQLLQGSSVQSPETVLNNSAQALEYKFAGAIKKLILVRKPMIAFTVGHGELDSNQVKDVTKTLNESYEVRRINISRSLPEDLFRFQTLIIAKPTQAFDERDKFKLDQYLMNSGKLFFLIDQLSAEMDSMIAGEGLALGNELNLDDLLFNYGARINYDLVQDLNCLPIPIITGQQDGKPTQQLLPWLYFPLFIPEAKHPIVNNLDGIRSEFANSIDSVGVVGVNKTVLLTTSPFSKLLKAPVRINLSLMGIEPKPDQFNKEKVPIAMLLEGTFQSVFKNRLTENALKTIKVQNESKPGAKVLLVSDGDIIRNQINRDSIIYPLGYDRYTRQTFGNKNFVLNAVDYLTDGTGLINVRSKELKLRLLNKAKVKKDRTKWQIINLAVPVLLIIVFGIVQNRIRKAKYAK